MKKVIYFATMVAVIFVLAGCATSSETYTADGKPAHSINCSGSALNWGLCYEKAGNLCGSKGYEVLEKSDEQGVSVTGVSQPSQSIFLGGTTHFRSMLIECKDA